VSPVPADRIARVRQTLRLAACVLLSAAALGAAPDDGLLAAAERLQSLAPGIAAQTDRLVRECPDLYALAMLKIEKARIAMSRPGPSAAAHREAHGYLAEALALWEPLLAGERPELPPHGLVERAYFAENDLSAQPYVVFAPEGYDGSEPYGLFVFLHGYSPGLDKANWVDLMYSPAKETLARETRCLVMLPFARGNTDFQGAGEDDVLRAIGEVKRNYNVDEDRVFLSGISMGGMGVWTIGAHNPHLFAALIPIASRGDFYMWKGIERGSLPAWKARLADGEFGAELLPNFTHLPCVIVHGTDDWVMPMRQSERMHALLEAAGVQSTLVKVEGATHYTWADLLLAPEVIECLKGARRRADPRRVAFRTFTLKHARAYWAEVTAIEDWSRPAEVECELDAAGQALNVRTGNVAGLRLQPPAPQRAAHGRMDVTWNGQKVQPRLAQDGRIELGAPTGGEQKRPGLCGPIREAYAAPFRIVLPADPEAPAHAAALQTARDWLYFAQDPPPLVPAGAVTDEMMGECNLVLFGPPEENELVARIAPHLPIGLGEGRYLIDGRSYDAAHYGLCVVHPNPLAPERLVVIHVGPAWGSGLAPNHKYDMLPDFVVFTPETDRDGTDSNRAVCAGFFDQHWRVSASSTWHAPEP